MRASAALGNESHVDMSRGGIAAYADKQPSVLR